MARAFTRRFGVAATAALVAMSLAASTVMGGEITGNGKSLEPLHSHSICAYSGPNDDPTGIDPENGPPGRTQSYGQDVRKGFVDPKAFNPGDACRGGSL
jgi:hypothetical protein